MKEERDLWNTISLTVTTSVPERPNQLREFTLEFYDNEWEDSTPWQEDSPAGAGELVRDTAERLRQSIGGLVRSNPPGKAAIRVMSGGCPPSLRALAQAFEGTSGIPIEFDFGSG